MCTVYTHTTYARAHTHKEDRPSNIPYSSVLLASYCDQYHRHHHHRHMEVKSNTSLIRGHIDDEWPVYYPFLIAVLTLNFITGVYRSLQEPLAVAFLVFSYSDLALLFWCVHKFEQEGENTARKERLKMAICVLPAILITMFTYRVAAIMPPAVKVLLWSMAGLSVCGAIFCVCLRGKTSNMEEKGHKMEGHEFESRKTAASDNV